MKQLFLVLSAALFWLAAVSSPAADFNGDGRDDIAIFRPSDGLWAVRGGARIYFGREGDIPVPGKFVHTSRDSIAIFRPSTGLWAVNGGGRYYFGGAGDVPIGGDGGASGSGDSLWTQTGNDIYYQAGNVGIGTNNPYAGLDIYKNSTLSYPHLRLWESANDYARINFKNTTTSNYFALAAKPQATTADARMNFFYNASGDIMSLTGNGDVGIGTTNPANRLDVQTSHSGGYALSLYNSAGTLNSHGLRIRSGAVRSGFNASENVLIWFARGTDNAKVGSINFAGTATLFNTTSDERLKENIADAASPSGLIDALRVRQFDWKESGGHQRYGFVAQELEEVAPEAVTRGNEEDENDYWGVDNSKLVPMLVKEIQELRARVSELESR